MRPTFLFAICLLQIVAFGQVPTEHRMTVYGKASFAVPADQAHFTFEVEGLGSTFRQAVSQASQKANSIADQLHRLGISQDNVTINNFQSGENFDKAFFSSKRDFSARISAVVTIKDMSVVSDAIFAVADAHPLSVSEVAYSVQAMDSLQTEALLRAIANAKEIGQLLAAQLGVSIRGVVEISNEYQFPLRGGRAEGSTYVEMSLFNSQKVVVNSIVRVVFAL